MIDSDLRSRSLLWLSCGESRPDILGRDGFEGLDKPPLPVLSVRGEIFLHKLLPFITLLDLQENLGALGTGKGIPCWRLARWGCHPQG